MVAKKNKPSYVQQLVFVLGVVLVLLAVLSLLSGPPTRTQGQGLLIGQWPNCSQPSGDGVISCQGVAVGKTADRCKTSAEDQCVEQCDAQEQAFEDACDTACDGANDVWSCAGHITWTEHPDFCVPDAVVNDHGVWTCIALGGKTAQCSCGASWNPWTWFS